MKSEFEKTFKGVSVYQNKRISNKKQYNLSLDISLMSSINKIQQGLQVMLDEYVGKGEIIENILKRGINSLEPAVAIDNDLYSFEELNNRYDWIRKEFFNGITNYLLNKKVMEKFIDNVTLMIESNLNNDITIEIKNKSLINKDGVNRFDIENIDIEKLDKNVVNLFIYELYDLFALSGNEYYSIRNFKYIDNIIPIEDAIKVSLFFYREINIMMKKYERLQKKVKEIFCELNYNTKVDEVDILYLITYTAIYYTKIMYDVTFNPDDVEAEYEKINECDKDKNKYKFKAEDFDEDRLLENDSYIFMLRQKLNEYVNNN